MLAAEVHALLQNGLHPAEVLHVPVDARLPHQDCTTTPTSLSSLHIRASLTLRYTQQEPLDTACSPVLVPGLMDSMSLLKRSVSLLCWLCVAVQLYCNLSCKFSICQHWLRTEVQALLTPLMLPSCSVGSPCMTAGLCHPEFALSVGDYRYMSPSQHPTRPGLDEVSCTRRPADCQQLCSQCVIQITMFRRARQVNRRTFSRWLAAS